MAFSRKSLYWLFGLAVAALVIGILIYFFRCDIFKNLGSCVEDPNETNVPVPPGSPTPRWVPETFPLNIGMFGPKIKALQKALGFQDIDKDKPKYQDGRFGTRETLPAIQAKGYNVPLSETDYQKIVNPAVTGGGSNFQAVKTGLGTAAQNFSGGVRAFMPGPNQVYKFDFYTNGRVFIYDSNDIEKSKGTYSNGGKTIITDRGANYTSGGVLINMRNIANDLG